MENIFEKYCEILQKHEVLKSPVLDKIREIEEKEREEVESLIPKFTGKYLSIGKNEYMYVEEQILGYSITRMLFLELRGTGFNTRVSPCGGDVTTINYQNYSRNIELCYMEESMENIKEITKEEFISIFNSVMQKTIRKFTDHFAQE